MAAIDNLTESELARLEAVAMVLANTNGILSRCIECRRPIILTAEAPNRCRFCAAQCMMLDPGGTPDPFPE